jgi:hypothetical protein
VAGTRWTAKKAGAVLSLPCRRQGYTNPVVTGSLTGSRRQKFHRYKRRKFFKHRLLWILIGALLAASALVWFVYFSAKPPTLPRTPSVLDNSDVQF